MDPLLNYTYYKSMVSEVWRRSGVQSMIQENGTKMTLEVPSYKVGDGMCQDIHDP